jgi:tRNA 2-thiouridine synthesizing protein A
MPTELTVAILIDMLATRDRPGLVAGLADDALLRAVLPSRYVERAGAAAVADELLSWFGEVPEIVVLHTDVEPLADIWHARFRWTLHGLNPERVVEQHWYCAVDDGRVTAIRLVCSGFRPAASAPLPAEARPARTIDALGEGCATLTPRIAAALRDLAQGEVLSVLADDPAAADDLGAWSRLTGHEIVATAAEPSGVRFYLRHA